MIKAPIIFLAFANDKINLKKNLRYLPVEEDGIRQALGKAEKDQLCKVIIRFNATLDKVIEVFQEYQEQIAIFHFSGHGDDYSICLETPFGERDIIHSDGFTGYLGAQKGLQLVFLNACATQEQSKLLHNKGIPIVISTLEEVLDDEATEMAIRFYQELAIGSTIESAYLKAINLLKSKGWNGNIESRGLWKPAESQSNKKVPWVLNTRQGKENVKDWSLPEAVDNPLYNLPILYNLAFPNNPFPNEKAYTFDWAKVFWGRAYEIRNLYDITHQKDSVAVVILYGASGVGKTSLLQAGLLPRISKESVLLNASVTESNSEQIVKVIKKILDSKAQLSEKELTKYIILDGLSEQFNIFIPLMVQINTRFGASITFVLSMRTSYLSKWETHLEQQLSFRSVFLPAISETGIFRVFKHLKNVTHYGFTGEVPLEESMVSLLHRDTTSPITPIFQVLMSRLWKAAKDKNHTQPNLSMPLYRELEQKGIWEDFIQKQLISIDPEAFKSGLLLNILQDCSLFQDSLSSQSFHRMSILNQYKHLGKQISTYLSELISKRILSGSTTNQLKESHKVRLSHSLLHAPLLSLINQSSKKGQEARRLLIHHQHNGTLLNMTQLQLIENHLTTLPDLSDIEKDLILNSKKSIRKKYRKEQVKKYRIRAVLVILLFGIFYSNIYLLVFLVLLVVLYK